MRTLLQLLCLRSITTEMFSANVCSCCFVMLISRTKWRKRRLEQHEGQKDIIGFNFLSSADMALSLRGKKQQQKGGRRDGMPKKTNLVWWLPLSKQMCCQCNKQRVICKHFLQIFSLWSFPQRLETQSGKQPVALLQLTLKYESAKGTWQRGAEQKWIRFLVLKC